MTHRLLPGLIAGFALLVLTACGGGGDSPETDDVQASDETQNTPARSSVDPDGFDFIRYETDLSGQLPQLCLVFTQALDPDTDYTAYLDIEDQVALNVDGSRLCLGGLGFDTARSLTLREGLPSASGENLDEDITETLSFSSRPPFVGFSGDGVILPRIEADGLAIQTVNVDVVNLRISRVDDRALAFRAITDGYRAGQNDYYYGGERPGEVGVTIFDGEIDTDGPQNTPVITTIPIQDTIGRLEAGAYYVEIEDKEEAVNNDRIQPARAGRWLIVTDLAFSAYRGEHGLDVVVRSLQSARPVAAVDVQLVAYSNEILDEETTGRDGRISFGSEITNGQEGDRPRLLMAYGPTGDFAILDLQRSPVDLSEQPISGRARPGPYDGYIYLDRGIYRPGEIVHASGLIRDTEAVAVPSRAGVITLYAPNGLEQAQYRFESGEQAGAVFHDFAIPRAAARGSWRLTLSLDGMGQIASRTFSVEDFVPQRVALDLDADTDTPLRAGEERPIEADVRFLYGAPGAGLTLEGTARVQLDPSPYDEWDGFSWGLHDEQFGEIIFDLPETVADGEGQASLSLVPATRGLNSSKPLRIRTVIGVQEPGGRAVRDDVRIPYRPRDVYFGLKPSESGRLRRNESASFEAIAVGADGAPVAQELSWDLFAVRWDYDWYRTHGNGWSWRSTRRLVPIESGLLRLDGSGPLDFTSPELDYGSYELSLKAGGQEVASRSFYVGWSRSSGPGQTPAPDEVQVTGPETAPRPGETARISIAAPYSGQAEVTVATDRVLSSRFVELTGEGAEVSLPVTEDWGAGAYVMVTVYTPRDAQERPTPRRAVGVAYIPTNVDNRTFDLSFDTPDRIEPNQTLSVGIDIEGPVSEGAWVTLAAVDEGILLLTNHQSPDPTDWYFGQTRLDVDLLDDYGRILDPNQGAAAQVRSGGDQIGGAGLTVVPTQSVVMFSGPVRVNRNGRATVEIEVPDFNGELRLMAVAWSRTGLGAASQPLTVRDDVAAELILPRFLAPGDEAFATATLDNVDGPQGDYDLLLSADGPLAFESGALTMALDQGQREDRQASLSAADEGIAQIDLTVSGPDNFSAASTYPIQIRTPYLQESRIERGVLGAGDSFTPSTDWLDGYLPGSSNLQVSFSVTPLNVSALFDSLYRYPWACTEQITSRTMPLLYAAQIAGLTGQSVAVDPVIEVQDTIETLLSRQTADGAFGLWRIGDRNASPWIGVYATDFLWRADAAGYPVPEAALERALGTVTPIAQGNLYRANGYDGDYPNYPWSRDTPERLNHRSTAYANYVLARAGQADRSRLLYLHDELLDEIESPLARAHVGAGLAAIGDRSRAYSAFQSAIEVIGYENDGDWYQTIRRDQAGILALVAEAGFEELVIELAEQVSQDLPEPRRLTTQEKAFLIMAARGIAGDVDSLPVVYQGEDVSRVDFNETNLAEAASFTNTGEQPVWWSAFATGSPSSPPPAIESGLRVGKQITDRSGNRVDLQTIRQGDRLVIILDVRSTTQDANPVIMADLLPAGFEIETLLSPADAGERGAYRWLGDLSNTKVSEARDDRFVAALDLTNRDRYRMAYIIRAVTPGEFAIPGVVAEDMYDPEVFGRSEPGRITIQP